MKQSKPRMLFFDDRHYAAQGAQKLLLGLATIANESGLDVTVGSTTDGAFLDLARSLGLNVVVTDVPKELDLFEGALLKGKLLRSVLPLVKQNLRLRKLVRAEGYDVVWAAAFRPIMSLLAVAALPRVKLVWQVMGSGYFRGLNELASLVSHRIVIIAEGLRPTVGVLNGRRPIIGKIRVVQTGVEPPSDESSTRAELQSELGIEERMLDRLWLVSIGAHIAEKGHLDVLRSVERLPEREREQVLLLIGGPPIEGRYRDELLEAAHHSPAEVQVHGWVSDVDCWLRAADIYVVASSREGMPLTLIEAMQRGTASVGYPVGGIPELLEHGVTGMVAPTGSITDLSKAIRALVNDRELLASIATSGQRMTLQHNSDDAMRARFRTVLNEIFPAIAEGVRS